MTIQTQICDQNIVNGRKFGNPIVHWPLKRAVGRALPDSPAMSGYRPTYIRTPLDPPPIPPHSPPMRHPHAPK